MECGRKTYSFFHYIYLAIISIHLKTNVMKKALLLIFVLLFSDLTQAQNWCAPGAEWHYRVYSPMLVNYQDGYLKLQVSSTNVVGGISYHTISMTYYGQQFTQNSPTVAVSRGTITTYEQNNVIYASMIGLPVDTIANFNASIGDKWRMTRNSTGTSFPNCPTVIPHVTVIDTGHVVINGQNLKSLKLSPSNSPTYTYTVIEKIGSTNGFMFAYYTCLVDGWSTGGFVCYSDNNFPLYQNPGYNLPCNFTTVGKDEFTLEGLGLNVFPNPASDKVKIEFTGENSPQQVQLIVHDLLGREVLTQNLKAGSDLDLTQIPQGLYQLSLFSENQLLARRKLLKSTQE
jgi:hypothetical protein